MSFAQISELAIDALANNKTDESFEQVLKQGVLGQGDKIAILKPDAEKNKSKKNETTDDNKSLNHSRANEIIDKVQRAIKNITV